MEISFELDKMNEVNMKDVCDIAEKINKLEADILSIKTVTADCDKLIFQKLTPFMTINNFDSSSFKTDYIKHEYVEDMHTNLGEAIKQFIIGYKRSEIDSLENKLLAMGVKVRRGSND